MKNPFSSSSKKHMQQHQQAHESRQDDDATLTSSHGSIATPYHDTFSRHQEGKTPSILWSAILRNDTLLVEADLGAAIHNEIQEASAALLKKPPTPGWEHSTLRKRRIQTAATSNGGLVAPWEVDPNDKLKGMKFHVYEHFGEEEQEQEQAGFGTSPQHQRKVQRRYKNNGLTIWTYACVYDPTLVDFIQVQSFLEKIVTMTEIFREPVVRVDDDEEGRLALSNPFASATPKTPQDVWRYGSHHAAQQSFAPVLLQRMEEVSYYGRLAMCHAKVDAVKEIMSRNIDLILENDERLAIMATEKAAQLNEMAKVFAKKSKQLKRQMLWNNAKHGAIIGTAITAGVAVVVVPTLVAIL